MLKGKQKYIFLFIWVSGIAYASLSSPDRIPNLMLFPNADKVIHFLMYGGLSFFLVPVFVRNNSYRKSYVVSFVLSIVFGALLEVLQSVINTQRSAELLDFFANLLGSGSGILFYHCAVRKRKIEKILFRT